MCSKIRTPTEAYFEKIYLHFTNDTQVQQLADSFLNKKAENNPGSEFYNNIF